MFLVIRADGKVWDGLGWNQRGKKFCTVGRATRSLHENGEDFEEIEIVPIKISEKEIVR